MYSPDVNGLRVGGWLRDVRSTGAGIECLSCIILPVRSDHVHFSDANGLWIGGWQIVLGYTCTECKRVTNVRVVRDVRSTGTGIECLYCIIIPVRSEHVHLSDVNELWIVGWLGLSTGCTHHPLSSCVNCRPHTLNLPSKPRTDRQNTH